MRLKLLFFPIVLVVSVLIILNFIVPQWEEMSAAKISNNDLKKTLSDIDLKSKNVESLISMLSAKQDTVAFVEKYLPENKKEERIIDGVNYLSSGLILLNVDIEKAKGKTLVADGFSVGNATNVLSDSAQNTAMPAAVQLPSIQYTKATIVVSGSYDAIMLFIGGLRNMELLNSFESVTIAKAVKNSEAASATEPEKASSTDNITAEIIANFGNLPAAKNTSGYGDALFQKSAYDLSGIDKLRGEISSNMPILEVSKAGKANPFIQ